MKLVALDLDGTLLRDDKTISDNTIEFLKKYQKNNNIVTLVSGRNYDQIKKYIELIDIKSFVICNDGINIYDFKGNLVKEFESFLGKDIYKIIDSINERFIYKLCYTNNKEFIIGKKKWLLDYSYLIYILKKYLKKSECEFITHSDLENLSDIKFTKILLWRIIPEKYYYSISKKFKNKYQVFWMSIDKKVQITSKDTNKLFALRYIQGKLNINNDDVIVFGNDGNDIMMLKKYRNSYVVKNGSNEAKEAANFITDSNNEDGVLRGLIKYEEKHVYQ